MEYREIPASFYASNELRSMGDSIRILLVDDHRAARDGLAAVLRGEPDLEIIGEAGNGRVAVDMTQTLHPDVILMDVRMPVLDGIEATRLIVADYPGVKVIGLTMDPEAALVAAMCKAGAVACLGKCDPAERLIALIRSSRAA